MVEKFKRSGISNKENKFSENANTDIKFDANYLCWEITARKEKTRVKLSSNQSTAISGRMKITGIGMLRTMKGNRSWMRVTKNTRK